MRLVKSDGECAFRHDLAPIPKCCGARFGEHPRLVTTQCATRTTHIPVCLGSEDESR
jgi:hypothetical protein